MALAIDVSTGTTGTPTYAAAALTTGAFTTAQAGELLVALVAVCGTDASPTITLTTAISGAGLSWTMAQRKNTNGEHTAEIWWAVASGILTSQTVTATISKVGSGTGTVYSVALEVLSFTGANTSSPIGASNAATNPNGTTASPSITLATTAGSYCVAAGADYWNNGTIATAGAAQTILAKLQDATNGEVEWTQRTTSTTGTSTTMGDTGTGSDGWAFVAAEIKAAASALTWSQLADPAPLPPALLERWEVVGY